MWLGLFVRDKGFYRNLAALALPIAAQQLITVGVNMADNIMLGQLGEVQMSGASLANNFITIFQICCMGLGMGALVLTSRFWGMQDRVSLKKSVNIMYRLTFLVMALFTAVSLITPKGILSIFTPEQEVIAVGAGYLLVSVPCFFLHGYALTTSLVLRSVGKATVPLISTVCSFFINIFFNWLFIFGNLGAPRMEAQGAALGTLLARVVEFAVTMGYFFLKDKNIQMRLRDLTMKCSDLLREYVRISIPVLVSDSLLGFGNSAIAIVMGHIGSAFVAANAITSVVMQLATVVIQGISQASCTITGVTLGRGEPEQAQRQGVTFAALGFVIGCLGFGVIQALKAPVIGFYQIEEETRVLAFTLMDAVSFVTIFQCMNSILTKGVLRGGGDTRFLMVADILFLWCASIPLGALAGLVFHLPGFWIYVMLKIDQLIKSVWCLFRLKSGKWIKKIQGAAG